MLSAAHIGSGDWNTMFASYNAYEYGTAVNLGNSGHFRDTLIYNDTNDATLQNLNITIGHDYEGGSFAKLRDKKYTVNNVEVYLDEPVKADGSRN